MRITSLQVYTYSLPLTNPIVVKKISLNTRQGLILEFINKNNQAGYGEIAPLPGFNREQWKDSLSEIKRFGNFLLKQEINDSLLEPSGRFQHWMNDLKISPSIRFGIEMGLVNLQATSQQLQLYELFSSRIPKEVEVNALLSENVLNIKSAAKKLRAEGYQTIKLKVGRYTLEEDLRRLQQLWEVGGKELKIRLDANRAWSLSEAVRFGNSIRDLEIEYIEEPLRDPSQLSSFFQNCGVPLALDESLTTIEPEHYCWDSSIKAIVLKPTIVGGLARSIQIIKSAQSAGIYPVFSSAFESGLTLSFLAQLAAVFSPPGCAAGLDTFKWLKEDLLEKPFRVRQGRVEVKKIAARSRKINFDKLKLVFTI